MRIPSLARAVATATTRHPEQPLSQAQIYISTSLSPYWNLSYEDWLFRHTSPTAPLLFLYRNRPSVIIGRNQNPWIETSPDDIAKLGITLVRRRSGGGTVFHDEGNTNYSLLLPPAHFHRPTNARLVLSAVHALGVPEAIVNERNDIYVGPYKMSTVPPAASRSAYKITQHRSYHHGTMLLTTRMASLSSSLASKTPGIQTSRGVESVRSPVANLEDLAVPQRKAGISHDRFVQVMKAAWEGKYGRAQETVVLEEEMRGIELVRKGVEELHTWEWTFGQTPLFEIEGMYLPLFGKQRVRYKVYHGVIDDMTFPGASESVIESLKANAKKLVCQRWTQTLVMQRT